MVEPRLGGAVAVVGTVGRAVVCAHNEQVGAVAAQPLVGLERATRLDVEEAVEHQDRQVVDIAAKAALAPPRVECLVLEAAAQAGVCQPDRAVQARDRIALEVARRRRGRRRANQPEHAEAGDRVRDPAWPQQVAVQVERTGAQHRGAHAGQPQAQRVVDGDRAGREAVEAKPPVAPGPMAGPSEGVDDVALGAVA